MQLPNRTDISDYETFMEILKREKADDPHFAQMVSIVPELKMSLDDGPTVVGYIVQQVSDIQVMYSYANSQSLLLTLLVRGLWMVMVHWARGSVGVSSQLSRLPTCTRGRGFSFVSTNAAWRLRWSCYTSTAFR